MKVLQTSEKIADQQRKNARQECVLKGLFSFIKQAEKQSCRQKSQQKAARCAEKHPEAARKACKYGKTQCPQKQVGAKGEQGVKRGKQSAEKQDSQKLQGHPSRSKRNAQHGAKNEDGGQQGRKTEVFDRVFFACHRKSLLLALGIKNEGDLSLTAKTTCFFTVSQRS